MADRLDDIIARLADMLKNQPYGGIVTVAEMPELLAFAPACGTTVKLGKFTVTRRKIDQLDQFTVGKESIPVARCPIHKTRLDSAGRCWWCDNPEE